MLERVPEAPREAAMVPSRGLPRSRRGCRRARRVRVRPGDYGAARRAGATTTVTLDTRHYDQSRDHRHPRVRGLRLERCAHSGGWGAPLGHLLRLVDHGVRPRGLPLLRRQPTCLTPASSCPARRSAQWTCFADPWSRAVQLRLTAKLPKPGAPLKIASPWAIELCWRRAVRGHDRHGAHRPRRRDALPVRSGGDSPAWLSGSSGLMKAQVQRLQRRIAAGAGAGVLDCVTGCLTGSQTAMWQPLSP